MSSSHIALAGATGNLGVPILQALLDAGYKVTALSRNGGNSSRLKPHPNLVVKQVDFTSADSISPALQDIDVVVSCLATLAIGSQTPLIDAAFGAGVKRFIPAEFGMDSRNPLCKELPVCVPKAAVQQYLGEKHKLRPSFTWTGIANGMFLDWCLGEGLVLNPEKHSAILYNGGDVPFSATTLADVATAVLGIIRHQSETENRLVYIHSALVTQSKLIKMAVDIDGKAWQTTLKDTEDLKRESPAELAKGAHADVEAAMLGFCFCGMLHPGYGCDFSDHLDNDLLGVKGLSDGELRAVMAAEVRAHLVITQVASPIGTSFRNLFNSSSFVESRAYLVSTTKSILEMGGDSPLHGKRTQFSSCDACRRSRVACDAAKFGHQPGQARWRGSCSRCSQKKKSCTFEWMNDLRKKPSGVRREVRPTARTAGLTPSESCDSPDLPADADDALLESWSSEIFQQGFETVFGLSVGRNSCPFVDDPLCDVCVPATKLFGALDACIDEEVGQDSLSREGRTPEAQGQKEERNGEIDKSLRLAIRAYTARWLPLIPDRDPSQRDQDEERIKDTWRAARREMLKVINRASYRSILTLCLFAQTPMPSGISEEEELDGLSGLVCLHTALLQIQRLRERQKKCQFRGSEASPWRSAAISSVPSPDRTEAFLSLESRAYWAAVVWDTSSSLTSNFRASLTSGLKGACEESVWRLSRAFLLGSWNPKAEQWLAKGFEVTDDTASQVFSAAAVCGVYMWKCITSLKEALIEGVDEEGVLFAWSSLQEGLEIFRTTLCPLLCLCERQVHFLDQLRRMSWYQINMKYYLGVLIMLDILEAAGRQDLLKQVEEIRMEVEHESFNILKFGMESSYTIYGPGDGLGSSMAPAGVLDGSTPGITASLIAVDPCPHHVVDYVALMHTALIDKYRRGKMKYEAYSYLAGTLGKALDQLPKHSKSVDVAHQNLRDSFQKPGSMTIPG